MEEDADDVLLHAQRVVVVATVAGDPAFARLGVGCRTLVNFLA